MTDQQQTPRWTSDPFTVDESTVLLGLLQLAMKDRPEAFGELADRVVVKIQAQLTADFNGPHIEGRDDVAAEIDALRLGRLLEAALADVAEVVEKLEAETRRDDRPVVLIGSAGVTARALANRIGDLGACPVIDLHEPRPGGGQRR
jgi:hypothetical protein